MHPSASLEEMALLTYQAMSSSDDLVLLLERDGGRDRNDTVVIGCNDAFRRASGFSNEQLIGRPVANLFPAGEPAETLVNAIRGTGSFRTELLCCRAGADAFMLGMHLMPVPGRTPGRDCFVILGRDITAAFGARQMQDSVQRLLAKVFTSVDAAVAIVNGSGRIMMTNPHLDVLLGYTPNGLVGRNWIDLLAPSARVAVAATVKKQIRDGSDVTYSAPILRMDGAQLALRITSVTTITSDAKQFRILTLRPGLADTPAIRAESVGRIKLVGLDEVRAALGDRWPAAAERAMATAESVIKRNCGPQDSFSRSDETSFLMCFGSLSEQEASFRAAMIGREIRNRLIGQGVDSDEAHVRAIAAVVRFPDQGQAGDALNAALMDGLDKQLERIERDARQTLRSVLADPVCDLEPVYGRNPSQVVASQVLMPYLLERQLVGALSSLPQKEAQTFDPDGLLLGLAARQVVTTMAQGDTMPLLIRISFEIFANRAMTDRFFATCGKIDQRLTGRLVLLLSGLPQGLPRSRLQDCVNRLRPFCGGVGYQVDDMAELPEIDLSNSFNPIVVLPLSACSASTPGKVRELFSALQTRRAKVLIRGVGSEKDAAALRSLGADMIAMKRRPA
jgi:PAS domain S-box-containing protein